MPKATAVFDADDSRLSGALARINGKMLALQSRIAKFAAAFIAIRAVAGVVTAGFDHFKQALDVGGQLNDLSANTGVAVGDLVVLQQEFANAGKSAEDIGPVFGKMAKSLQGGSADGAQTPAQNDRLAPPASADRGLPSRLRPPAAPR